MLPDVSPVAAPAIDTAAGVVWVEIPIPLDVPFSDVLVTTWSDYTLVCSLVYGLGLIMGAVIWEVRARRIQKRAARQE